MVGYSNGRNVRTRADKKSKQELQEANVGPGNEAISTLETVVWIMSRRNGTSLRFQSNKFCQIMPLKFFIIEGLSGQVVVLRTTRRR